MPQDYRSLTAGELSKIADWINAGAANN